MVRYFVIVFLGLCLLLNQQTGFAQPPESPLHPLVITPAAGSYFLSNHSEYIEDRGWSFQQLLDQQSSLLFLRQIGDLSFGYVNAAYWIRFQVANQESIATNWVVEISGLGRAIDQVDAYIPNLDGQYQKHSAGDRIPFNERSVSHHAFIFHLALPARETRTVYLRVRTNGTLQIPIKLWSSQEYIQGEHNHQLLEGMFFGVLLIMLFYNAFIYWTVKDNSYILYVCYLVCVLGFSLSIKGVGFEYLWPTYPEWNNKSNMVFAGLGVVFVLLFAKSFLRTKRHTPLVNTGINCLLVTSGVCLMALYWLSHSQAATLLATQYCLTVLFVLIAASLALKRGFTAARYYLLAWLSIFVSIFLWVLNSFNLLSSYWVGSYLFQIGTTLQVLLFSFALADRISLLRKEREAALETKLAQSKRLASMAEMFERFVPKQFLDRIAQTGIENIQLGKAEADIISVLFADIRAFTSLSESLEPQELLNFLNAYLERIDQVIHNNDGCIDKFIGDGVMAIFENPVTNKSATSAVSAAVQMQEAVRLYNSHRAKSGYQPISIGIGVNTGPVVIGTVGSKDRMDSTVLGDNVNVAARLQDLTKELKAKVIISDQTLKAMGRNHGFHLREVGDVLVRGRKEPVHIYEVLNADCEKERSKKMATLANYRLAYENFRNGRYAQARIFWQRCLDVYAEDTVVQYLLSLCDRDPIPDARDSA